MVGMKFQIGDLFSYRVSEHNLFQGTLLGTGHRDNTSL